MPTSQEFDKCTAYLKQDALNVTKFEAWFGPALNGKRGTKFAACFGVHNDGEWVNEKDKDGFTLLHIGMEHKAPAEAIKLLVEAYPEAVKEKNKYGSTPLQFGMKRNVPAAVIKLMVEACPEAVKEKDKHGRTPLHFGMKGNAPAEVIKLLVEAWPAAAKEKDEYGWTPLHEAFVQCDKGVNCTAPAEVIKLLVEACPEGVKEKTAVGMSGRGGGKTPLLLGMMYKYHKAPAEVIKLMVDDWPESVKVKDKDGNTPYDLGLENEAPEEVLALVRTSFAVCSSYLKQGPTLNEAEFADWFAANNDDKWTKESDEDGDIPLHVGMLHKAPAEAIKLLVEAWPEGVNDKDKDGRTPLHCGMQFNAPAEAIHLLLNACPAAIKDKDNGGKTPLDFAAANMMDALFTTERSEQATTATSNTTTHYHQLLTTHHHAHPPTLTAPLSERLAPIRDVLSLCVQTELQFATPALHTTCDFHPYQHLYLDPAIKLISAELEVVQANISTNPDLYRTLLASLSTEDRKIYNSSFEKSINVDLSGDQVAHAAMLERCAALKSECEFVSVDKQPTSDLIPLVLMVRGEIPAYKTIVEGVIAQAAATISGTMPLVTIYRPGDQTKSPYRMVEKALTKGPNREYPDCSQILDVFGCIIDCQDYVAMAAVVDAFADQHKSGTVSIARMKDRWNTPSEGGWRDLMLNIVVNGKVVFEVQVVLRAMLAARSAMDAHKAYNQFRSFAEVFGLLELSMEAVAAAVVVDGGGIDGGDGWDAGAASGAAAATTTARFVELEAKVAQLEAKVAAVEAEKAAVAADKATIDVKVEALAAGKAAVEAERDADKQQYETKIAQLQAQLAARD